MLSLLSIDQDATAVVDQSSGRIATARVGGEVQGSADLIDTVEVVNDVTFREGSRFKAVMVTAHRTLRLTPGCVISKLTVEPTGAVEVCGHESPGISSADAVHVTEFFGKASTEILLRSHQAGRRAAKLRIGKAGTECKVRGVGTFEVCASAVVDGLYIEPTVFLIAAVDSNISGLTGEANVVECAGATLAAPPGDDFRIVHLPDASENVQRVNISGVRLPESHDGRRFAHVLARCAGHVTPTVSHMSILQPGPARRIWAALPADDSQRRRLRDRLRAALETPVVTTEGSAFALDVAALTDARCPHGSTRTLAAWAAYEARRRTAPSAAERAALGVFRQMGYGQRPGAPLAWWLFLVLAIGAVWRLPIEFGQLNVGRWVEGIGWQLLSPMMLLRLAGDPELRQVDNVWDGLNLFLQTLVAIPLIFAGIATSRYLRSDWPFAGTH